MTFNKIYNFFLLKKLKTTAATYEYNFQTTLPEINSRPTGAQMYRKPPIQKCFYIF
jgi:hypothetical protein